MNFELDDDQAMIRTTIERFVSTRYAAGSHAVWRAEPHGYSHDNWRLLAEVGLLAAPFSVDDGGVGSGAVEVMVIMRALGRGLVVEPVLTQVLLAGGILAAAGSSSQKAEWLTPLMAGDRHLGLALEEQAARWSQDKIESQFGPTGLHGRKSFATGAVDGWIVSALRDGAPALFLVHADAAGVSQRPYRLVDGSIGAEVSFDKVDAEPLPGAMSSIYVALDIARIGAAAEMTGLMDHMFDATLDYVRTRRQFGVAIGSFQAIQHRLADLYARIEMARSQLLRAAMSSPEDRPRAVAAAKAYISETAIRVGEESIQMHGGMGTSEELDIGSALKRVLVVSTMLGDPGHETRRYNALMRPPA